MLYQNALFLKPRFVVVASVCMCVCDYSAISVDREGSIILFVNYVSSQRISAGPSVDTVELLPYRAYDS